MRIRAILLLSLAVGLNVGCGNSMPAEGSAQRSPETSTAEEKVPATDQHAAKNVVLWISVDGFRGDYVDRGVTPFLGSLMRHGAFTRKLSPVFPSLTFPSHISEATGILPGAHGIVSNVFFDSATGTEYKFPGNPNVLQAEPIWLAAARQNVRTAVLDWPLSHGEEQLPQATVRAAYFNPAYDLELSDADRIGKLVATYRDDSADPENTEPLQLLMGYVHDIDTAGHIHGPDAPETTTAIAETDLLLRQIVDEATAIFKKRMRPERGDNFYVLITTDHGMAPVKTLVHLRKLVGGEAVPSSVLALYSGSVANIYLNKLSPEDREKVKSEIVGRLKGAPFAKFWLRDELPAKWGYANATRTGDIVISLKSGYSFTHHGELITAPIESNEKALKGMHGYDPATTPDMLGFMVLYRYGSNKEGVELEEIDSLQLHPTVAKLLNIQPATGATCLPVTPLP